MKTLHLYLTRQVLASLLMTVAVFTFVLLLVNVLKEILMLLVNRQATFGIVLEALGLLIPFVLVFALPMGMLTATLLVFGRFSADQELTAARASGISLLSLITPTLLLSLALCAVSAWINLQVAPLCRVAYKDLLFGLRVKIASVYLPEGRFVKDIPGFIIYVGKNTDQKLRDVMVYKLENETNVVTKVRAPRGYYTVDVARKSLELHLLNASIITFAEGRWIPTSFGEWSPPPFDLNPSGKSSSKVAITDMTFTQLQQELHELERQINVPIPVTATSPQELRESLRELKKQRQDLTSPLRVQIHRQVAFSFACFGFTLVGIPLGIRVHRRETNVGIAIALVLVLVYYSFLILGESLATRPEWAPHLIVWLPNFIFQAVGAVLLWRANRGV